MNHVLLGFGLIGLAVAGHAQETTAPMSCCGVGQSRIMAMLGAAKPAMVSEPTSGSVSTIDTASSSITTSANDADTTPPGMVWIPGGQFTMGTDDGGNSWPAERPAHQVKVNGFWMDKTEVTNADFAKFVKATNYITTAETTPTLEDIMSQVPPGTPPPPKEALVPGALVFTPPDHPVELNDESQWWMWVPQADWKHPEGPGTNIDGKDKYPVAMVSWLDAQAYAKWAGKRLPTEAEWERAARGGLEKNTFAWGNEFEPSGKIMANIWQGEFPHHNTAEDTFPRSAPVASFPPNGYGLYDTAGNVWEWTNDWFDVEYYKSLKPGEVSDNPKGPSKPSNPNHPFQQERVIKGGSFLCHPSYCSSYRPSARLGNTVDTGMSHLGFRCVKDK
jgi:formylglycine-generating enzyme required for sulfatase activity